MEKLFSGGSHDSKDIVDLKNLRTALKDRFACTEDNFLDVDLDDIVSEEFAKLVKFTMAAEKKIDFALLAPERLREATAEQARSEAAAEAEAKTIAEAQAAQTAQAAQASNVRQIKDVDIPSTGKAPGGKTPAGKTPEGKTPEGKTLGKTVTPTTVTPTTVTPTTVMPTVVMPTVVTPAVVTPTVITPTTVTPTTGTPTTVTPTGKTPGKMVTPTTVTLTGKTPGKTVTPTTVMPTTVMPTTVTPTLVTSAVLTPKALMPGSVMPTAVTPTKAIAEAEARSIAEAEASAASTKAALEVRQILDVDIPYIRQKHLWCRSAPPIDVRDTIIGSPVTIRWVRTNADTQVFTIIDVQGALLGSPVTFRWVRTNTDAYSLAHKPSHGQSTTPHGQPHRRRINNLITNICTINAVWTTSLPVHRQSTPLHEFRQRRMGSLIAGTRTTSSQTLAPSTLLPTLSSPPAPARHGPTSPVSPKSPTLPIATLPALLAGIGFTMTEALPSISWRPAPPPPLEAAHLDLQASLTLPTLSASPNQGLTTSTSS